MKQAKLLVVLGISIGLLTGCGSKGKTLTCSYDSTYAGARHHEEYVFSFDKSGSKLQSYVMDTSVDYDNNLTEEEFKQEYEEAKEYCDEYSNLAGIQCTLDKTGNKISAKIKVKMSKLDDEGKKTIDADEIEEMSLEEVKENFEDSDYVCHE